MINYQTLINRFGINPFLNYNSYNGSISSYAGAYSLSLNQLSNCIYTPKHKEWEVSKIDELHNIKNANFIFEEYILKVNSFLRERDKEGNIIDFKSFTQLDRKLKLFKSEIIDKQNYSLKRKELIDNLFSNERFKEVYFEKEGSRDLGYVNFNNNKISPFDSTPDIDIFCDATNLLSLVYCNFIDFNRSDNGWYENFKNHGHIFHEIKEGTAIEDAFFIIAEKLGLSSFLKHDFDKITANFKDGSRIEIYDILNIEDCHGEFKDYKDLSEINNSNIENSLDFTERLENYESYLSSWRKDIYYKIYYKDIKIKLSIPLEILNLKLKTDMQRKNIKCVDGKFIFDLFGKRSPIFHFNSIIGVIKKEKAIKSKNSVDDLIEYGLSVISDISVNQKWHEITKANPNFNLPEDNKNRFNNEQINNNLPQTFFDNNNFDCRWNTDDDTQRNTDDDWNYLRKDFGDDSETVYWNHD